MKFFSEFKLALQRLKRDCKEDEIIWLSLYMLKTFFNHYFSFKLKKES